MAANSNLASTSLSRQLIHILHEPVLHTYCDISLNYSFTQSEKPLVPKDNVKGRFDSAAGAAAVDNKPSSSTWRSKSEVPEKEPAEPVPDSKVRLQGPCV